MAVCLKQISMPIFNGGEFWDIFNLRVVMTPSRVSMRISTPS